MEPSNSKERIENAIKERLANLSTMSKGQLALEALSSYRAARLPVPDDVLRSIDGCYRSFLEGKPVARRVAIAFQNPSPLTLGEAFGVPDIKGGAKTSLKRRRMAMSVPTLLALFTGQGVMKLPRTKEGYQKAAQSLGLTQKEVEGWVSEHLSTKRLKGTSP